MTDDTLQTCVSGVCAAGDVRGGSTKQVASAVGEGTSTRPERRTGQERG